MTYKDYEDVIRSKVDGAWNLHNALAAAHSPVDFFVALSSVAGIVGNRGQAAYSAANVFLDGFMEYRRSLNLPGTSIDLGAVLDAGYLFDTDAARREEVLKNIGGEAITNVEVLALLAAAITGTIDKSSGGQVITGLGGAKSDSFYIDDSKFSPLRAAVATTDGEGKGQVPLRVQLKNASSKEEGIEALTGALIVKLSDVLGLGADDIDPGLSVSALGLDSLVAIEIRNWIAREADANVQVLELLSTKSVTHLAEVVYGKSGIVNS